jgi:DNA invertase Pin-like site-specific DNA recombinase
LPKRKGKDMKKKVHYIRVSTAEQNTSRQETVIIGALRFEDKESGLIEFKKRTKGKQIWDLAESNELEELHVHSIDRLGRNTLDILNTIQFLTTKGVNVISTKEGLQTMVEGKENPIAKLMIGILATLSEFEVERMKERQREGIQKAKDRKAYIGNGGDRRSESIEEFLNKKASKRVLKHLKQGDSIRRTAKLAEVSIGTVQKVIKLSEFEILPKANKNSNEEKLKSFVNKEIK